MRSWKTLAAACVSLSLLAACSESKTDSAASADAAATNAEAAAPNRAAADQAGPGIDGVVAPGVAFDYAYAFTLPAPAIARVQQEHAAACERLGAKRCRVTGMEFKQPAAEEVRARLDFLLAPDLAHRFASEGIAAVERADGTLDHAEVGGRDAGKAISLSQSDSAALEAEVARVEARLRAKGLTAQERVELQRRVDELHGALRSEARDRQGNEAALASTPVSFAYASESLLAGNSFGKAAAASAGSAQTALSFLLLIAGIALPWVGLAALGIAGWRWIKRFGRPAVTAGPDVAG